MISVDVSESDTDEELLGLKIKLARDLRKFADDRGQFEYFDRSDSDWASDIFFQPGYYRVGNLRRMQEHDRAFFIASLRKHNTKPTQVKSTRLASGLAETFQTRAKNPKCPRIEEVQTHREMNKWAPSFTTLAGILVADQEMVNRFTIELARGLNETPTYTPFVTGDLSGDPWLPTEPSFARAHDGWKKMQASHKRPNEQPMSIQLYTLTYLRFVLAGDLAKAWGEFGGLSAN